jgi:exosortase A
LPVAGIRPYMEIASQSRFIGNGSLWVRSCVILCCSLLIVLWVYWPTAKAIVGLWRTSTFSHGFLVIPVSIFLMWTRRDQLRLREPTPTFWAIPVLLLLSFGWLLADLAAIGVVEQFCFVATAIIMIWGVLGTAVTRALLMPLAFLLFAVPFGEAFVPKLQDFSAWFAVKALDLCRVPVLLEGRFISVPSGKWEVAEACSGIRYLTSSLAVGFLFAGLMYRTWIRRVGFFVASAVVPILANAVRVFGIVFLAYESGNRIAAGVDHIIYGWIFFAMVMSLLLAVGGWWREKPDQRTQGRSSPPTGANEHEHSKRQPSAAPTVALACCGLLGVVLAPLSAKLLWAATSEISHSELIAPVASLPVRSTSSHVIDWKPEFLMPSAELAHSYEIQGQPIDLYIAYYAAGQPDAKVVSSTNTLFDRTLWLRTAEDTVETRVDGQRLRVHETFVRSSQSSLIVWSWYWVDGRYTSSDVLAKLLLVRARFLRDPRGAAIIAIAAEDRPDQLPAVEILRQFLGHISLRESLTSSAS